MRSRLEALERNRSAWRKDLPIDPTNFGRATKRDAFGQALDVTPRLVVMHETVYSMTSAINTFLTPHPRDEDQVSYHTLIGLDGKVVDLVDPIMRAYGAGYSSFLGRMGDHQQTFQGKRQQLRVARQSETPAKGPTTRHATAVTPTAQYDALALVLSGWINSFNLAPAAITTHRHVDIGGERSDPRSFDWSALQSRLLLLEIFVSPKP